MTLNQKDAVRYKIMLRDMNCYLEQARKNETSNLPEVEEYYKFFRIVLNHILERAADSEALP